MKKVKHFICSMLALCLMAFPMLGTAGISKNPIRPEPISSEMWFAAFDHITVNELSWKEEEIGADIGWTRWCAQVHDGRVAILAHVDTQTRNIVQVLVRRDETQKIDDIQADLRAAGVDTIRCLSDRSEEEAVDLMTSIEKERKGRIAKGECGRFAVELAFDDKGNLDHIRMDDRYAGR